MEQKGADDIINIHEKQKRKLEEELRYKLNIEYLIKFHFLIFKI
jgi:hypothetical protein